MEPRPIVADTVRRAPLPAPGRPPLRLVELAEGGGSEVVRTLRRRESVDTLVLADRSGRRELLALLSAGVRGAVTVEAPGAVHIRARPQASEPMLSDRDRLVLHLVADGHTNDAVGACLGVSGLTIKSHLSRIGRKLGTGDRAAMVAVAIRRRLIP